MCVQSPHQGESHWRDMLALTWNFRTVSAESKIKQFLHLSTSSIESAEFSSERRAWSNLTWINLMFELKLT